MSTRPRCPKCEAAMNRLYVRIKQPGSDKPASKSPMSPCGYSCVNCNVHFTDLEAAST